MLRALAPPSGGREDTARTADYLEPERAGTRQPLRARRTPGASRVEGVPVADEVGAADSDAGSGGDGVRVAERVVVEEEKGQPVHAVPVRDALQRVVDEHIIGAEALLRGISCARTCPRVPNQHRLSAMHENK